MRLFTMMAAAAALALLLPNLHLSRCCDEEGGVMICQNIPSYFSPGYLTLVMYVSDIGEINSTVFSSSNLSSVTRLRIDNAGVTGIAEGAFVSFQNLTSISLQRNAVPQVNPRWFGRPAVLRELILTENLIEAVNESTLSGLINLTKLSLNKNRIRSIGPNSFRSQTSLAELDLSENRMTRVSPQAFSSLRSTRIRLDGNPWDCSCGAEDFVVFLKDLQSRSLLDRQMGVTCESPASLRGRPVWNVSVCTTPGPASVSQTVHQKPTDATVPAPSAQVTTTSSQSAPKTETSDRTRPADEPIITSSHSATPPAPLTSETSVWSTDVLVTLPAQLATYVTTAPSETKTFIPPLTEATETCVTPGRLSDTNTVCTLTVVIVVLCVLLSVVCFLAVQHRRKRSSKAVTPGRPREEKNNSEEDDGRANRDPSAGESEDRDLEMARRRPFTGVRAKSANAVLCMSPLCASGKDQVTVQNETEHQSKDTENQADRKQKLENETEATGGIRTENTDTAEENEKQADADRKVDEKPHSVSVSTDTVPYLSIGTNQNKPNPDNLSKQSADGSGQRSQMGKVLGRISTWPPTAVQWQARCKMKEEEEENESGKFPGEAKTSVNKAEHPSVSGRDEKEDEIEENRTEDLLTAPNQDPREMNAAHMEWRRTQFSELNYKTTSFTEAHTDVKQEDPATMRHTIRKTPNQDLKPAENPARKSSSDGSSNSSSKAERRSEPKRAVTSRQRAENRRTGSTAPSGGASPDDETLLHGNEYAFMDLLHEVVQNNGRWTRERWKQIHVNKQRR